MHSKQHIIKFEYRYNGQQRGSKKYTNHNSPHRHSEDRDCHTASDREWAQKGNRTQNKTSDHQCGIQGIYNQLFLFYKVHSLTIRSLTLSPSNSLHAINRRRRYFRNMDHFGHFSLFFLSRSLPLHQHHKRHDARNHHATDCCSDHHHNQVIEA